jgi:phosphoribosylamine--glycine ligase
MNPTLGLMKKREVPFRGFLYAGIMIDKEKNFPYVLEFNVRMGDPECQTIMMRMKSDFYEYIDAASNGLLSSMPLMEWDERTAVCVVMAARGYPGSYQKGYAIEGLDEANRGNEGSMIFHAGTFRDSNNTIISNGGRVRGVTALGKDTRRAIDNAYSIVRKIHWGNNEQYYRTDIARRAMMHYV